MSNEAQNPLSTQVGGSHYKDMQIQPADANGIGFLEGSIIKYVSRHKAKGGADDLRKAIHCAKILLKPEYGMDV
jgi:hypothetical protein